MFVDPDEVKSAIRWSRSEVIRAINETRYFDVVVVGGGIHGAAVARLAAFNGLKTALFEASDYASATSSRSSKLAHGGLRYLAQWDFRQVFESVKAREDLFEVAAHLVYPHPFLIPVERGAWLQRAQFSIALPLYEYFTSIRDRRHQWIDSDNQEIKDAFLSRANSLSGCFRFYDGIMSDSRLVIETILAARQEGAFCLNYARVDSINQQIGNEVDIGWTDMRSEEKHRIRAGVVVNCAGPWAPGVGRLTPLSNRVRYSRGSHLIFSRPWEKPALFLPLEGKNRYYFVLPHPAGTLVGTTEREIHGELPADPIPEIDEVKEILSRLESDIPEHGLDSDSLIYGFAGIRTLPLRGKSGDTSTLSRRHVWDLQGGVLTLYGGKYTSAYWTALEGLELVKSFSDKGFSLTPITGRKLPGAFALEGSFDELLRRCSSTEQQKAAKNAHRIFGGRVREFFDQPGDMDLLGEGVLRGAVRFALEYEQVETLEDLMRRRLEVEYGEGHGFSSLSEISKIFAEYRPGVSFESEATAYRDRLKTLHERLGIKPL